MTEAEIRHAVTDVFRLVFEDDALILDDGMTAADVPGWDSLNHINLIVAIEQRFAVRFTTREVNALQNVGELLQLIARKLPA